MRSALALVVMAGSAVGCTSDVVPEVCPAVGVGDLVITELRGNAGDVDLDRDWVEITNVGGGAVDLRGLHLRLRGLTGAGEDVMLVRSALPIAAAGQVVLGAFDARLLPEFVDYGWQPDFMTVVNKVPSSKHFPTGGILELYACDVLIDRVQWTSLPALGTRSLGLMPPDAGGNDDTAAWCEVASTPGAPNTPCP